MNDRNHIVIQLKKKEIGSEVQSGLLIYDCSTSYWYWL